MLAFSFKTICTDFYKPFRWDTNWPHTIDLILLTHKNSQNGCGDKEKINFMCKYRIEWHKRQKTRCFICEILKSANFSFRVLNIYLFLIKMKKKKNRTNRISMITSKTFVCKSRWPIEYLRLWAYKEIHVYTKGKSYQFYRLRCSMS